MMKVTCQPIPPDQRQEAARLLQAANLCHEDIGRPVVQLFRVKAGGRTAGYFGYEIYGPYALFRSLVLAPGWRGRGLGRHIWQLAARQLQAAGVQEVYLLTNTAAPFFSRLGFKTTQRETAPEPIRQTEEFRTHCPEGVECLYLKLTT